MNIPRDMNEFRFGFFQYEVAIITALDYLKMGCANEAQKRLIEVVELVNTRVNETPDQKRDRLIEEINAFDDRIRTLSEDPERESEKRMYEMFLEMAVKEFEAFLPKETA